MVKFILLFVFSTRLAVANYDTTLLSLRAEQLPSLPEEQRSFNSISADPLNLIHDDFAIPSYFREATEFWFAIYTKYSSDQVVVHHRESHSLIFDVIDVTGLLGKPRAKRIADARKRLTDLLKHLSKSNGACPDDDQRQYCLEILKVLQQYGLVTPKTTKERAKFYLELASSVRSQSGQKNFIQNGLAQLAPLAPKIDHLFKLFDVPGELIAIAFLESSFNTRARSRVGAAGVWQFIKTTGQQFFTVTPKQDDRLNPLISTLGALQMLKQNQKIAGRWDLAIWSYNSGLRHILEAKKELKTSDLKLSHFLENYEHPRIGFASKSFYSSFLALVHVLAYHQWLIEKSTDHRTLQISAKDIYFYVMLCKTSPSFIYDALKKTSPDIEELNTHLSPRYKNTQYPRGTIIVSDRPLTERRYFKVPEQNYTNRYPRNWSRLISRYSCSTK